MNAIKQAEWFTKRVDMISFFTGIEKKTKINELMQSINIKESNVCFDVKELMDAINKSEEYSSIDEFYKAYMNKIFSDPLTILNCVVDYNLLRFVNEKDKNQLLSVLSKKKDGEASKDISELKLCAEKIYSNLLITLLNDFEAFSMNFTSGVADDSIVFDSLHQLYIRFIRSQYVIIAKRNINNTDKYYTHCISLYNEWSLKRKQLMDEEKMHDNHKIKKKKTIF